MRTEVAEMTPDDKAKTAKLRDKIALLKQAMSRLKNQARPGMSSSARAKQRQAMYNLSHKKLVIENQILVLQGKKPRVLKKRTINNGPHKITHTYIEVQPRVRKPKPENAREKRMSVSQKLELAAKKVSGKDLWVQARKTVLGEAEAEYQKVIEAAHKFALKHGSSTAGTDVLKLVYDKSRELSAEHTRLLNARDAVGPLKAVLESLEADLKKYGFRKARLAPAGSQVSWVRGSARTVQLTVTVWAGGNVVVSLRAGGGSRWEGKISLKGLADNTYVFKRSITKKKLIDDLKLFPVAE